EITGYDEETLLGLEPEVIFDPEDDAGVAQHERLLAGEVRSYRLDRRIRHAAGHHVWVSVSVSLLRRRPDDSGLLIGQVEDISERKRFEGQLAYLADHDHLTGLLNRRAFQDEVTAQLAYARRYAHAGAILVVDLDNFKDINDTLGHAAGDELISRVAGLLRVRLRKTDVLGRLGGDEFAVVLPETGRAEAELVARELLAAVRNQTVAVDGDRPLRVSASVGVALYDAGTELTAEEVLVNADIAMYDAKEAGRSRVAVSAQTHERQAQMKARLTWAQRIREALAEDRFTLYQQPIVDLGTGRIAAHELLLRMVDDRGEIIPPGAFLPVAERCGLVQDIDRWVVRTGIRTLAREQAAGRRVRFEVNLSGASVTDPDLEHFIEVELAASGADPAGLVFELTETAAIVNVDRARRFATRLGELGCEFALDDFGAGFGSFYYLKHLPFDYLKIDGDFVRTLSQSREDQHVVKAIVEIASGMGKKTVAEFVGDEETVAMLADFGVDFGQGYFLGRPGPLADILAPSWQPALTEPVEHSAG
ncbi:MAG TPA: EAL domain-containing protein, partial [Solirubrobacteraceae bacterium]